MSTYDFEPDPDDFGPEPAHIAGIAGWKRDQAENLANQCKLVDQIAALTKERDALKEERDEFNYSLVSTANRKLRSEVDVLRKERDALKEDVAHYKSGIPVLTKRVDEHKTIEDWQHVAQYYESNWSRCSADFNAVAGRLTAERDAYEKCADTMAAAHKVERDALKDAARRALNLIENMAHFEHEDDPEKPFSEAISALKAVL